MVNLYNSVYNCGNDRINAWVKDSYFAKLTQQAITFRIIIDNIIVGYFMLVLNTIVLEEFKPDIHNFFTDTIGNTIPCLELKYIAIDKRYQRNKYGYFMPLLSK